MQMKHGLLMLAVAALVGTSGCSKAPVPTPDTPPTPPAATETAPQPQAAGPKAWSYTALAFQNEKAGWAAVRFGTYGPTGLTGAESALIRTGDGGATWSRVGAPAFTVRQLQFLDLKHAVALGLAFGCEVKDGDCAVQIATSDDAGTTWENRYSRVLSESAGDNPPVLGFTDAAHGYALYVGGTDSRLLLTADGGKTWGPVAAPAQGFVFQSAAFADGDHGWAHARNCSVSGGQEQCTYAIFATADAGQHWTRQFDLPAGRRMRPGNITFLDKEHGWLYPTALSAECSMGGCTSPIYRTADGGKTWTEVKWTETMHTDQGMVGFPRSVWFVSPARGWMLIGSGASNGIGGIGVTADGGATWDRYAPAGVRNFDLLSVTGPQTAWAVGGVNGQPGVLMRTTDGGPTWAPVSTPFPQPGQ